MARPQGHDSGLAYSNIPSLGQSDRLKDRHMTQDKLMTTSPRALSGAIKKMVLFARPCFPFPQGRKPKQIWRSQELDPAIPEANIFSFMTPQPVAIFLTPT